MSDERQSASNDPLDVVLAQAQWPEAKHDAHARLVHLYRAERTRGARRVVLFRSTIALAASVMIVFAVARFDRFKRPAPRLSLRPVARQTRVPVIIRPPTNLESAIIATQLKREAKVGAAAKIPPAVAKPAQVQNLPANLDVSALARELSKTDLPTDRRQVLLVRLLNAGTDDTVRTFLDSVAKGATRDVSLAAIDGTRTPPIDQLIDALRDPLVDRRIAAARALGYIDGPILTSRLIKMAENGESRREAMIALACSRGEAAQRYLDRAASAGPMVGLARSVRVQFDVQ